MRDKANEYRGLHEEGILERIGPKTIVKLLFLCFLWCQVLL
jgi:hypothetical protein